MKVHWWHNAFKKDVYARAKSKTEIGATSQRAVNLDGALWEIIAFPFP